ncbi:hypothetical protein GIHI108528_07115 [Gillisia hiemivivida]
MPSGINVIPIPIAIWRGISYGVFEILRQAQDDILGLCLFELPDSILCRLTVNTIVPSSLVEKSLNYNLISLRFFTSLLFVQNDIFHFLSFRRKEGSLLKGLY